MSLRQRAPHAAAGAANSADHPFAAAACDAAVAEARGSLVVSAVSTPTYFASSYDLPLCTLKLRASVAVSVCALGLSERETPDAPLGATSVEATVPCVPIPWVANPTATVAGAPETAPL